MTIQIMISAMIIYASEKKSTPYHAITYVYKKYNVVNTTNSRTISLSIFCFCFLADCSYSCNKETSFVRANLWLPSCSHFCFYLFTFSHSRFLFTVYQKKERRIYYCDSPSLIIMNRRIIPLLPVLLCHQEVPLSVAHSHYQ